MNDRELLKAAAKAAGYPAGRHVAMDGLLMANDLYWNPLTDDGDALRLAVALKISLQFYPPCVYASVLGNPASAVWEDLGVDFYVATRRAVVRSAAKIGRANDDQ